MNDLEKFEAFYRKSIQSLSTCLPEGVIDIDLAMLQELKLLEFDTTASEATEEDLLTRYFSVIETDEKITLINDRFVIWIVPETTEEKSTTYTLIALNASPEPKLEVVFSVTGVYNTSRFVLRVLEKFLHDIQENEEELARLKRVG